MKQFFLLSYKYDFFIKSLSHFIYISFWSAYLWTRKPYSNIQSLSWLGIPPPNHGEFSYL